MQTSWLPALCDLIDHPLAPLLIKGGELEETTGSYPPLEPEGSLPSEGGESISGGDMGSGLDIIQSD